MKSTLIIASLVSLGAATAVSSSSYSTPSQKSCPAPGTTNADGDYSCNPAHQYPAGQICVLENGCYYLRSTGDSTSTSQYAQPTQTSCPAPGSTNAAGKYSCNPAHQYPTGQTCQLIDGCYFLVSADDDDCETTTSAGPEPTQTSCAPPGTTNDEGEYSCNPAHKYPDGQTCQLVDGCYVLKGDEEDCDTTTSTAGPKPTNTACPAPGSYDAAGRYSCNPAHQYPAGQTCQFIDNCYFLVGPTTSTPPKPQPTAACPAPGSTNSKGDYSCNPAHQYPAGQTCVLVDGCYVLRGAGMSTSVVVPRPTGANNGTHPGVPTIVPGSAAGLRTSSMSVVAGLMAVVYFAL